MAYYQFSMTRDFYQDSMDLPTSIQKKLKRTTMQMLKDPMSQQLHPEKIENAEPGIRSCRIDEDYRIIWKKIRGHVIFCLADKHDRAYTRAARTSFTLQDGVIQMRDILEIGAKKPEAGGVRGWFGQKESFGKLFIGYKDDELLAMGVPPDVLPNVRALDDANQLPDIKRLLQKEDSEDEEEDSIYDRLIGVALGIVDRPVESDKVLVQSLERHQGGNDLYTFINDEEFQRALAGDMEEWMLFLAPHQRDLVTRNYAGPARVRGVAGSGKTVIAIHRARHLGHLHGGEDTVLFLTFGNRLPTINQHLLTRLAGSDAPELAAIECRTIHSWCFRFLRRNGLDIRIADGREGKPHARDLLIAAIEKAKPQHPNLQMLWTRHHRFFEDEIRYAIKGRAIERLDDYLRLERSGRGVALNEAERRAVWDVFKGYQDGLHADGLCDWDDLIVRSIRLVERGKHPVKYRSAVVDEIQDLTESTMRLIRSIVEPGANDLFLVGDGLQRLFPGGYVLGRIGLDIAGRGTVLRKNYRNTQEILRTAFAMMDGVQFNDLDDKAATAEEPQYSPRHGAKPALKGFPHIDAELCWVVDEIKRLTKQEGYHAGDFAVLARNWDPYEERLRAAAGDLYPVAKLTNKSDSYFGPTIKYSTFDSAKGLEFKVVFAVGCTDGAYVPYDDWHIHADELEDYLMLERSRFFVAMTRARDRLYLTYSRGQPSRFLNRVPAEYLESDA